MRENRQRILLLEDDALFSETIEDFLDSEGYDVACVADPYSALEMTYSQVYDLYILDINLPFQDGFSFLRSLRDSGDLTHAIFLTSRDDKESLVSGFESGCDDYMQKPIDLDELLFRIRAVLRRESRLELITIGDYSLDTISKKFLDKDGERITLSHKTVELLILLLSARGRVVTADRIKDTLWSSKEGASDGSLRVYITQLKKYFPDAIINIRGVGYQFDTSKV